MLDGVSPYLWLVPLGFLVGAFGTLIGAGGGFLLAPILLIAYPEEPPEVIAAISLAVVFFNACSGSIAYAMKKRIDFASGLRFAAAAVPSAIAGAFLTSFMPRRTFELVFGVLLIAGATYLVRRPRLHRRSEVSGPIEGAVERTITDQKGTVYRYSYSNATSVGVSAGVGLVSSFLGIGGGILHVPLMVRVLDFPVHLATATSHMVLAITALAGTLVHVAEGEFHHGLRRTALLAIGVIAGAQLGARASDKVKDSWIIRALGLALGVVGVRVLVLAAR